MLKAARGKQQVTYKGNPICLTADLSAQILQARREWQDIFKVLKGKNLQPRLLYPARISFKSDGEIESFSKKQKLRKLSTIKPEQNKLWKILKEKGIPDHLTCLLRNIYAGQEATVRTGHGSTDWFQIGNGV